MNRGGKKRGLADDSRRGSGRRLIEGDPIGPRDGGEDSESDVGIRADAGGFEPGCFASRCSLKSIREVLSKFPPYKKDLVKALGFEGLLHFPSIRQFNRKFAMWLMRSVDVESGCLKIGDHICIKISKVDAVHVLGLPGSGKKVMDEKTRVREAKEVVLNKFLGVGFKEHRSIKVLQSIIEREYTLPMSEVEEDTFKVAFVVYVVSTFLAPSAKNDYASIDYWNAIAEPKAVKMYDWAEYVIAKLFEAVSKLKQDLSSNIKFPIITGCSILLQVLYLDSLELRELSMSHNSFPRIREFSYEKMRLMIEADKNYERYTKGDDGIPCLMLRDARGCIYSWAVNQANVRRESRGACLIALWEAVTAMVQLLNIPLEAAGPLFVAAADFQEQVNSGLVVTGTQAIKFMSVLVSIMMPYCQGLRNQQARVQLQGTDEVAGSIANGISLLAEPSRLMRPAVCNTSCASCSKGVSVGSDSASSCLSNCSNGSVSSDSVYRLHRWDIGDHVEKCFSSVIASLDEMPSYLDLGVRVTKVMSQYYSLVREVNRSRAFDLNADVEGR